VLVSIFEIILIFELRLKAIAEEFINKRFSPLFLNSFLILWIKFLFRLITLFEAFCAVFEDLLGHHSLICQFD
jgi:hypothetical protein